MSRRSQPQGGGVPPPNIAKTLSNSSSSTVLVPPGVNKRIKVLSMGSGGVGKSCLIKRHCEDRFVQKYIATIGIDYGVKPIMIDGGEVRVNFWDLSGHPEFFEIRNEFYKDTQGALLVYDVTNAESFDALDSWLAEAQKFGCNPKEIPICLCANKVDKAGTKRLVSEEEGKDYATSRGMSYFETSAQSGQSVNEMFDFLFKAIVRS